MIFLRKVNRLFGTGVKGIIVRDEVLSTKPLNLVTTSFYRHDISYSCFYNFKIKSAVQVVIYSYPFIGSTSCTSCPHGNTRSSRYYSSSVGSGLLYYDSYILRDKLNNGSKEICSSSYPVCSTIEQRRNKSSKKSKKRPEYDSDSDSEDEEDVAQGTKIMRLQIQSLRTDGILKKALTIARNRVETAFYEGNIRVNGKKPVKKSQQLKIGDEVDLIKGVSPVNPDLLSISRIEVVSVSEGEDDDKQDQLVVKVRRTKNMYVENYESDPFKIPSSS